MSMIQTAGPECLNELRQILESSPRDDSPQTIDENLALIQRIGRRDNIVPLIDRVINDPVLLAEVAARSYRHVNHFDKIVLVGSDKLHGYRLTLHLWIPPYGARELKKESIHDHRFNFWSMILTGTLTSENFMGSPEGDVMCQYRYIPEKRATDVSNFYEFVGETRLVRRELAVRRAGESYYQCSAGIHRVILPESMTCTLVLRGPRQKTFTNTFRTDQPKMNSQVGTSMYSSVMVAEKLTNLLRGMARG